MKMMINDLRRIFGLGIFHRRTWRYFFQYLWNGWSDMDTWAIDWYIAKKIQPILERFDEIDSDWTEQSEDWVGLKARALKTNEEYARGGHKIAEWHKNVAVHLTKFWW